jgi:hypothetical protein
MLIEQVRSDILKWIQDFVEVPNPALGDWPPCPFARAARLNNLIDIRMGTVDPYIDIRAITTMSGFEVIVLVYEPEEFVAEEFNELVYSANTAFLAGRNLIALADHPKDPEIVCGVTMNQGQYALVFVQDLSRLNLHARQLADKGFYNQWPEDYLKTLFCGRQDPRS